MNVLITGGTGFIGSHLARFLHKKGEEVTLFDMEPNLSLIDDIKDELHVIRGDLASLPDVKSTMSSGEAQIIYHLGAFLSAKAEDRPMGGFRTNLVGTFNVLEAARLFEVEMVIFPSSIAAFGEGATNPVPNEGSQRPTTMYGVAKVAGELLGEYYYRRFGVNFRCLRLPSVVGLGRGPGGASAYSSLMIEKPARGESCKVYVGQHSKMPILYIKDALRAFLGLQEARETDLKRRTYNIGGISPTAGEIAESVRRYVKGAGLEFHPDKRMQEIVDSWPDVLDEARAREEWGWAVKYSLDEMVEDFVKEVRSFGAQRS